MSLFNTLQELDHNIETQIETLKNEVREILVSKLEKPYEKVHFIDSIFRLGVKYHFDQEIEEVLQHIHKNYVENGEITIFEDNLCSLAVLFRLLRQQGLHVSPSTSSKYLITLISFYNSLQFILHFIPLDVYIS